MTRKLEMRENRPTKGPKIRSRHTHHIESGRAPRVRRARSQIVVQVLVSSRTVQSSTRACRVVRLSGLLYAFDRTERRNVAFLASEDTRAVLTRPLLLLPPHTRTYICIAHVAVL